MTSPSDSMPVYGPQPRPALQQAPNSSSTSSSGNNSSQQQQLHQQQQSFPLSGVPSSSSSSRWRSGSLVPSGFECVAHPVFFRTGPSSGGGGSGGDRGGGMMGRAPTASSATNTASLSSHDHEDDAGLALALSTDLVGNNITTSSNDNSDGIAGGGESKKADGVSEGGSAIARTASAGGERDVDVVCPICLDRFDQPVTLTSCLHTFCHTCILGWYEHTVAVALAKGRMSSFLGAFPSERGVNTAGNTSSGNSRAPPAPYRCPLCQVPGPYFLAVEPASPALSKAAGKPKLKFRLLGARTVLGGGGPASGGVEVERADGSGDGSRRRRGVGYPGMVELRAAVRTQLALAAAVSALEGAVVGGDGKRKGGAEYSAGGKRGGGDGGRESDRRLASTSSKKKRRSERHDGGAKESDERLSSSRSASGATGLQFFGTDKTDRRARKEKRQRRAGGGEGSERTDARRTNSRLDSSGKRSDSSRSAGDGLQSSSNSCGSSGVEQRLPWEPGALTAEDALADVEAMLHREKAKLPG